MKLIVTVIFSLTLLSHAVCNECVNYPLDAEINFPLDEEPAST